MRRSLNRVRRSQPTLFHPAHPYPPFQALPPDVQKKTIRLLARLLRQADQTRASGEAEEARNE
jgi:hypothetical protein